MPGSKHGRTVANANYHGVKKGLEVNKLIAPVLVLVAVRSLAFVPTQPVATTRVRYVAARSGEPERRAAPDTAFDRARDRNGRECVTTAGWQLRRRP